MCRTARACDDPVVATVPRAPDAADAPGASGVAAPATATVGPPGPVVGYPPPRRIVRASSGRLIAGVAKGIAVHLGVGVWVVRAVLIVLTFASGAGVALYGLFWAFAPLGYVDPTEPRRRLRGGLVATGAVVVAGLTATWTAQAVGIAVLGPLGLPLILAGTGVVLLWLQADDAQRDRWRSAGRQGAFGRTRWVLGTVLVLAGGAGLIAGRWSIGQAWQGLLAMVVAALGVGLVTAPWWMRMVRELGAERAAREREQERAEIAAHLHDSVLQTLALIQRHVEDPRAVARLARAQERDLRGWLYRPARGYDASVKAAVEELAAEVEDTHGATVDVVVVGDCPVDEGIGAMLQAAREALVNAARHAGPAPVSVYVEVEAERVTVFVRDRGPGFDLAAVPEDRLGVRESIIGRMRRNGGVGVVGPAASGGTEVRLEMPRAPQAGGQQ